MVALTRSSHECCILGCQEQILCRPLEVGFQGHKWAISAALLGGRVSRTAGNVLVFGLLLHTGIQLRSVPILLRWLFSLQWPVLRRKMVVCWCCGSWWSASCLGLYPPVLLWEMAFFLLRIRVCTVGHCGQTFYTWCVYMNLWPLPFSPHSLALTLAGGCKESRNVTCCIHFLIHFWTDQDEMQCSVEGVLAEHPDIASKWFFFNQGINYCFSGWERKL